MHFRSYFLCLSLSFRTKHTLEVKASTEKMHGL